jgi:hypothetical protein
MGEGLVRSVWGTPPKSCAISVAWAARDADVDIR